MRRKRLSAVRSRRVERTVLVEQFAVTDPPNGTTVSLTDVVRGKTPFLDWNIYLVITPLNTGDDWVQSEPVKVTQSGLWTGKAEFGTGEVGIGEKFLIRALATKETLAAGPLTKMPDDALFSDAVTVTRRS